MSLVGITAPMLIGSLGQAAGFGLKAFSSSGFTPTQGSGPYYGNMPTLNASANDVQFVIVGLQDSSSGNASIFNTGETLPSGWTLEAEVETSNGDVSINVFSKVGSNTASNEQLYVSNGSGTSSQETGASVSLVFSGADTANPFDIAPSFQTGTVSNFDPPSVTVPNIGSIIVQFLLLDNWSPSTSPAVSPGYDPILEISSAFANNYTAICGTKITTTSPENAGAMAHDARDYAFVQFAIKEAA